MRKLILNLAMSLDGFISDEQGGFDWIVGHGDDCSNTKNSFDFSKFMGSIDTIVMGSKAYEDVVLKDLDTYEDKKIIVATSRLLEKRKNVEFVNGDLCNKILKLKKEEGGDIWLYGGAIAVQDFIKEDLVDKYIVGIIPILLGKGRLLFKGDYNKINLHLDEVTVNDGITILIYNRIK